MSEHQHTDPGAAGSGRSDPAGTLLTAKAAAIAGFTFAVLSMTGQGTWSQALQSLFWGANFSQGQLGAVLGSWSVATLLLAAGGWLLGRRTLGDPTAAVSWEGHLARAAIIVAAVGGALSALGILGAVFHAAAGR